MANKRPKPEEIVTKLRQVEVLTGQGMPRLDAIRQIGVTEQTFYRWSAGGYRKGPSGAFSRQTNTVEWAQTN
jgi:transposase